MGRFLIDDDLAFFSGVGWGRPTYNPQTHDLVPKPSYMKTQLELKEKQIKELEEETRRMEARLREMKQILQNEIDELKKTLSG